MGLPRVLTLGVGRTILKFKKQSPHLFFAAGVAGSVASTVLACRATLKLSETIDEIQADVKSVKALEGNINQGSFDDELYTKDDHEKDIIYVYAKAGLKIGKLYAPAAIVGVVSISALTGSHIQLSRRNTALMAAYTAVQEAYDNYRSRVRDQLGNERELEIYHATSTEIVKSEDGKKEETKSADPSRWSPYAKMFDEYNSNWNRDPELNRLFIQCQQNYANNLLRSRGHIFLNEVYDMLGTERSKAGAVVGWVIGPDGDNFIDFGIMEAYNHRFVEGIEPSIILDFNVDGVIYDKI